MMKMSVIRALNYLFYRFLYTGDSNTALENCLKILDAAKAYAVQGLTDKCLNVMKSSMTPESVSRVMEIAHVNRSEELRHRCLNFIVRDSQKVFASDGLVELCSECLCLILEDERLSLSEEVIFHTALKYSESKCRIFSIEPTAENKQTVLGTARFQIRFPCMSPAFFSDVVQPSGILSDSETVQVYKYFINPASRCNLFKTTPRNVLRKVSRFCETGKGWGYKRDKQDAITFTCSHDIQVRGVELFSTGEETANYEVTLMLVDKRDAIIRTKYAIVETDSKEQTYSLMFDEPGIVQMNEEHAIFLSCRGPPTYYGLHGSPLVQDGEISFHFVKNERSTNNTNVERGQIASILYSLEPNLIH